MNLLIKAKTKFYWLPAILMIASAVFKFMNIPLISNLYETLGVKDKLIYLGVIELISVIFYLFKSTMLIGFLLICAFWGGVIGIGIITYSSSILPIVMLLLFAISFYWREPALFSPESTINKNINI